MSSTVIPDQEGSQSQLKYLKEMEKVQFYSRKEILDLQWERLRAMLDHAYNSCPFYTKRFQAARLDLKKIQSVDDLEKLPVLTKADIQNNLSEMISQEYLDKSLIKDKTGGSTGSPLVYYYNRERLDSRQRLYGQQSMGGVGIGDKVGLIWGAHSVSPGWENEVRIRNQLLTRNLVLDTSSLTEEKSESMKGLKISAEDIPCVHKFARHAGELPEGERDFRYPAERNRFHVRSADARISRADRIRLRMPGFRPVRFTGSCRDRQRMRPP
jgi:hypothetical protein